MKKRIIPIFLSVFLAITSACSAQQHTDTPSTTPVISAADSEAVSESTSTTTVEASGEAAETLTAAETTTSSAEATTGETTSASTAEITEAAAETSAAAETTTTSATTTEITSSAAVEATTTTTVTTTTAAETSATAATATAEKTSAATTTTAEKTSAATEETQMTDNVQNEKKVVALTFDDGPNTTTTNEVLDVLEKYGITASFFLIGNNINDESAKSVKRAYDMGCEIGNHSKSHSDMTKMTEEEILEEIEYTNEKVIEITGEAPTFFRPPFIAVSPTMIDCIEMPFISGYGANDWVEKYTAEHRAKLVIRQVRDGAIILLHDSQGNSQTVAALDIIIPELQSQGYEFVTISEVFERKNKTPQPHDGRIYSFAEQVGEYS